MLKLTHSFCRYLTFASGNYNRTFVREFIHLNYDKEACSGNLCKKQPVVSAIHITLTVRFLASKRKSTSKHFGKRTNEKQNFKQMSEKYNPSINHASYGGKFDVSSESVGQTASSAQDNSRNTAPEFRMWEGVGTNGDLTDGSMKFRIVSYNVLAQYLLECHPYLYIECEPNNLRWKVRASRIYDEIISQAPDIICLQEVQVSHLESFYSKFEEIGYRGIFKQKTGHRQDGCAIYFRHSLFELLDHANVEFYQPELPLLNRDNIGVMVKLLPRNLRDHPIVVATTHLLYNPKRTDVRLAQMQVFLAEIDRFSFYNNGHECRHLPIILTGDFNSTPDSAVIKLLDRGHVRASPFRDNSDWRRIGVTDNCQHLAVYIDRQKGRSTDFNMTKIYNSDYSTQTPGKSVSPIDGENGPHNQMFNSGVLGHSLQLTSVYDKCRTDGQYEATTFQDFWLTVDYIYFSCCSSLKLLERLRLPIASECEVLGWLPNSTYGSDHLMLGASFELKPIKSSL